MPRKKKQQETFENVREPRTIRYVKGDATDPQGEGNKIIVHCCNDIGVWGAGFVLALSKKWPQVEKAYREWFSDNASDQPGVEFNLMNPIGTIRDVPIEMDFALGHVQYVWVAGDPDENDAIWIANMVGQRSVVTNYLTDYKGREVVAPPVRYTAILKGLKDVGMFAEKKNATVHAPRFGAGLAGGNWNDIEMCIQAGCLPYTDVTIYDFE